MQPLLLRLYESWWWQMPPDRLRVALSVLDLLHTTGGRVRVDIHSLSTILAVSRRTVDRAIEELVSLKKITACPQQGRGGGLVIETHRAADNPAASPAPFNHDPTAQELSDSQKTESKPAPLTAPLIAPFDLPVLDLQKSPSDSESDPSVNSSERSPTLEIETNNSVPAAAKHMTSPETTNNPQPAKRRAVDPVKLDRHAWAAADGMRARILRFQPDNVIGTRKWEGQSGTRLSWAHAFDLMSRLDKRGWMEISDVMRWLYPDGTADPVHAPGISKFVILSPESLRAKWDRVRAAQVQARTVAQPRNPDGRPDRQADRPMKRWDDTWDDDGGSKP